MYQLNAAKKISRRKFLLSGAAITAVTILGVAAGASFYYGPEKLIADVVRYHLPFKKIDSADLADFARHYVRQDAVTDKKKLALLLLASPVVFSTALRGSLPESVRAALDKFERRVLTKFLLSTDFFEHDDPYTPELTYNGFYDPIDACGYPLVET